MPEVDPAVTVVVPLYNTARYIAEALDSLAAQTFDDFEVVVVDDASRDEGPSIVRRYMECDPRICMIRQENRGLAGARNSGIRAARGRYIALLDADDAFLPDKLACHVRHLDENPVVGVSYAPSLLIDEAGHPTGLAQSPRLTGVDAAHIFCRNPVGNGSAAVLRRAVLDELAYEIEAPEGPRRCWFDETFRQSEDIEMWCRIAATTRWRFEGIAAPLTLYRVNTAGLSANIVAQFETWRRFRDKLSRVAPELVRLHGRRAEAYQRRYLARRASMSGSGTAALEQLLHALRLHPAIFFEEPKRTVLTFAFAAAAALLPSAAFKRLKVRLFTRTDTASA